MLAIASHNEHKFQEIQQILQPIQCISAKELGLTAPDETGLSFIENALIKARYLSKSCSLASLADDSGLVIPALNGAPGIYSARYAKPNASDAENRDLILEQLKHIHDRRAYFFCAIVYLRHAEDPCPLIATAILEGSISTEVHGEFGFGYDPIFYMPKLNKTLAMLSQTEKNKISHRAQALEIIKTQLWSIYASHSDKS